jgi:uncharacterized membrane protein YgdD (TMEM256/DUF423 family)
MPSERSLMTLAVLLALTAVAAGAFATHGLQERGDAHGAMLVATAARYQMWHALAIIACLAAGLQARLACTALAAGAVLFSGSLYALAAGAGHALGWLTPLGGLLFLLGWLLMVPAAWRWRSEDRAVHRSH